MTDPLLTLILLLSFVAVAAAVRYFKTLEGDLWSAMRTPLIVGIIGGVLLRFAHADHALHIVLVGIVLTLAALYVRLTGDESEPADGMLLGAVTGAATAFPLAIDGNVEIRIVGECILAGAVAGYGIVFAAFHVADKLRQFLLDAVTAAAAIGAAYLPTLLIRTGLSDRRIAIGISIAIPLVGLITVLKQWPDVRAELRHEASLGFIDDADVRRTAHPLLRLGRGGWADRGAHREFVRLSNKLALRKRQQRGRSEEAARLYQLEIIKLRMQIQEMASIDRATRNAGHAEGADAHAVSDTMPRRS